MSSSSDNKQRGYASPPCYQHELDPNYLGATIPPEDSNALSSWDDVRSWRVATRSHLNALRRGLTDDERARSTKDIITKLQNSGVFSRHQRIGFYWPLPGEVDLRPLMATLRDQGIQAALPVIIEPDQALEFWAWHPGDTLDGSGPWGIPVPASRQVVEVSALLIPLLGFDDQGHRLGHGGGYYDRTLASMDPRPETIGIGLEICRVASIFPQAHDIPMDIVVTESRCSRFCDRETGDESSDN